jgi:hypothetical protein
MFQLIIAGFSLQEIAQNYALIAWLKVYLMGIICLILKLSFFSDDDCITFDEFFPFLKSLKDPSGELMDAFRLHDKNGDGFLDEKELKGKSYVFIKITYIFF